MQRPAAPKPPPPDRKRPTAVLVAAGVAIVIVGAALALNVGPLGPAPTASPAPSYAAELPTPISSTQPSGLPSTPAVTATPNPNRPIVYSNTIDRTSLWSVIPGGKATQLSEDGTSGSAAWSRDGTSIAFLRSGPNGTSEVWVMAADGSAAHAVTTGALAVGRPTWSPSGDRIAFEGEFDTGYRQIWVVPSTGGKAAQLTYVGSDPGSPSWSPDGHSLAYADKVNGLTGLTVMDPDNPTAAPTQLLLTGDGVNRNPTWSPDGSKIAFDSTDDGTDRIWVVNSDSSGFLPISPPGLTASAPAWSPDGTKVVFQVTKGSDTDLYVMPADGSAAPADITKDPRHAAFDATWW